MAPLQGRLAGSITGTDLDSLMAVEANTDLGQTPGRT
jgi:hypothetical protein